ncbi:hypothetical protein HAX54_014823 [Datura stramonium]|uniref:Putative plant transposon protein domain-containing protein n=1 Tax=Datura stramonium TaxID=4076 RepID=A0ABS8TRI2_DATST|nr:hypothetical protein [Datura stramonium]
MDDFYIAFKEKCVIHAEARFDVDSFKTAYPDIYHQIGMRDWGSFTLPVDLYLPEIVWEFDASYRARQKLMKQRGSTVVGSCLTSMWVKVENIPTQFQWVANLIAKGQPQRAISKGLIHQHDIKFEAHMWLDLVCSRIMPSLNMSKVPIEVAILLACIMDHIHINVEKIIADQFKRKPSNKLLHCHFLTWMVQANGMITLVTKIDKEDPAIKWAKFTRNMTLLSSSASNCTATAPLHIAEPQSSPPLDLLNIAQRDKIHENQLVRLAKALTSMIQGALKKALQPAKDKLASLCSTVDVLE